jgi:hypothetical protein
VRTTKAKESSGFHVRSNFLPRGFVGLFKRAALACPHSNPIWEFYPIGARVASGIRAVLMSADAPARRGSWPEAKPGRNGL